MGCSKPAKGAHHLAADDGMVADVLRTGLVLVSCCLLLVTSATASAQSKSATAPAAASAVVSVTTLASTSIPDLVGPVLVVAGKLQSDVSAPRAEVLSVTLARLFAGSKGFSFSNEVLNLPSSRIAARRFRRLVHLSPVIQKGRLLLTVDVYPIPRTVWDRARNPAPGAIAHAFAEAPIDAEIRSHLEAIPLDKTSALRRAKNLERDVLSMACSDLDRDGAPELVMLSRGRISLGRLRGSDVVAIDSKSWSELSPLHHAPLREPIAFVSALALRSTLTSGRNVFASVTDRAQSVILDARLEPVSTFPGLAIPDAESYSCARLIDHVVSGPLERCGDGERAPSRASVGGRYDALASGAFVEPNGRTFRVTAGREDQKLEVFDDSGRKASGPRIGAQLAVGDRNQDGRIEVFASLDVDPGTQDAVLTFEWDRISNKLAEKARLVVPAGVRALAVCPPDDSSIAPLAVATVDEVWIVR